MPGGAAMAAAEARGFRRFSRLCLVANLRAQRVYERINAEILRLAPEYLGGQAQGGY